MTQDLLDWLNSTHTDKAKDDTGTGGLLLAPVLASKRNDEQEQTAHTESESITSEDLSINESENDTLSPNDDGEAAHEAHSYESEAFTSDDESKYNALSSNENNEAINEAISSESESLTSEYPSVNETEGEDDEIHEAASSESESLMSEYPSVNDETLQEKIAALTDAWQGETLDSQDARSPNNEGHASILNQTWHEATGFHINFDDPPPQMWTDINSTDDDSRDYEENQSLQGDAYIPVVKHGANFTQRLQSTLKNRKDKAAHQRELDASNKRSNPYAQKAMIFCGLLLMTLGFAYFGLWFVQRETPDSLTERAATQYNKGKYDEAANLYGRGYKRYPHVLTFLTGLARSAEKAGRTQTAIAAWNEYISSLPRDDTEHRQAAQLELDRLVPGGETSTQTQTVMLNQTKPETRDVPRDSRPSLPSLTPMTFDEALNEANNSYNIGMFSRAISSFHRAHAIRPDDLRPYVGLIASYRAKGMYFDAKRLIDEARKKFGLIPELEIESYYLRRE